jgi:hypothetical protein
MYIFFIKMTTIGELKFRALFTGDIKVNMDDNSYYQRLLDSTSLIELKENQFKDCWIIFSRPNERVMHCGKNVNWNKSDMYPINIPKKIAMIKNGTFMCFIGTDFIVKMIGDDDIKSYLNSIITVSDVSSSIIVSGGTVSTNPTAFLRTPDGTLTPVYGNVTVFKSSIPNPISGPVYISRIRQVPDRIVHLLPRPADFAHLASSGQVTLGEMVRRGVFDHY